MSENLTALKLFIRAARTGSFSRAGRELGLSQPTASRMIANLEKELGAGLFTRTTRMVTLTEAGAEYLVRVEAILLALDEANHAVGGSAELRGTLRVGVSSSFSFREIIPRLPRFVARHPVLHVDFALDDQRQDLLLEGVDVAIRLGPLPDSAAIARRITALDRVLVAAPAYLAEQGTPATPEDLIVHRIVAGPVGPAWSFRRDDNVVAVEPVSMLSVSLNEGAIVAAVAGLGIAVTGIGPRGMAELADGRLVRLLPDWEMPRIEVHAVYAGGRTAKPAARMFTEFLVEEFSN